MASTAPPAKPFKDEDLALPSVSKRALLTFVSSNANIEFLKEHGVAGSVDDVIRNVTKDKVIELYNKLYEAGSFKGAQESGSSDKKEVASKVAENETLSAKSEILYSKQQIRKGDKVNFPHKGDTVYCWYTGSLENGTIFDSNTGAGKTKKPKHPLSFKVGVGRVIRGWDEALLTMSKGEKSKITIESEWAYGKKGKPEAGIPPNSRLIFEVELANISF